MPEVGDLAKPKGVLFLDEAHLIFSEMSSEIIKKITQIIKLIRSKGISVFFISQSPADIPDEILAQLGNRIQHSLRAYTPQELKAVKTAASTFRENPELDTEQAILELGTGEALVSFVDPEGLPSVVEKAKILPPQSYMGEITQEELQETIRNSVMDTKYRNAVDRVSAYENIEEINKKKAEEKYGEYLLRKEKELADESTLQKSILQENLLSCNELLSIINTRKNNFWCKRKEQNDFLLVRVGIGKVPLMAKVNYPKDGFTLEESNLKKSFNGCFGSSDGSVTLRLW